jgi:hypothetical protein
MNERIKELMEQAGLYDFVIEAMGINEEMEKFAELIVRECLTLIDDKIADLDSYAAGDDEFIARSLGAYQAKEVIMDHFGVE